LIAFTKSLFIYNRNYRDGRLNSPNSFQAFARIFPRFVWLLLTVNFITVAFSALSWVSMSPLRDEQGFSMQPYRLVRIGGGTIPVYETPDHDSTVLWNLARTESIYLGPKIDDFVMIRADSDGRIGWVLQTEVFPSLGDITRNI